MSTRVILTYDDYAALPDDGRRYELYDGELVLIPSPNTRHQLAIGNLYVLMVEHVRRQGLGPGIPLPDRRHPEPVHRPAAGPRVRRDRAR